MSSLDFEQVDVQAMAAVRITGRVKWFDAGKGYGFIVPDDPSQTELKDVLLHVTSLRSSGRLDVAPSFRTPRAEASARRRRTGVFRSVFVSSSS